MPQLRNFNVRNGLPGNEVYQVYEDKKGHIWICTDAGIARYNSGEFKVFNSSNGLPDNTIFEVKEDRKGRIWFRSFSGKAGFIFKDEVFAIGANEVIPSFLKGGIIGSFQVLENGDLILGKQGVSEISFLKVSPPYEKENVSIIHSDNKVMWGINIFLSGNGEVVFSERRGEAIPGQPFRVSLFDSNEKLVLSDSVFDVQKNSAFSRINFKDGKLYFANATFFKEYDLVSKKIRTLSADADIVTVYKENEQIWLGLRDNFVCRLKNFGSNGKEQLASEVATCTSILKDFQGGYWFGTLEKGVFYLDDNESRVYHNILPAPVTTMLLVDGNKLYAACSNAEVFLSETKKNNLNFNHLDLRGKRSQPGFITRLIELDDRRILIHGRKEIFVLNKKSGGLLGLSEKLSDVKATIPLKEVACYKNNFLFCSFKCLFVLDTSYFFVLDTVSCSDRLTSVVCHPLEKTCYVGALHGLYRYNGQKELSEKDKVSGYRVEQLVMSKNNLVIATKEHGLIVKNPNGFDTINVLDGLLSNICRSVKTKQDTIWVKTNLGISEIVYRGNADFSIKNYSLNKLGDFKEINDFEICGRTLILRSGNDFCLFSLDRKKKEDRIYITGAHIGNDPLVLKDQLELPYNGPAIRFEYEALFYWNKDKTLFRYRLNNDADWNYTTETFVSFPGLSAGEFVFMLEAKNDEGTWVKAGQVIHFSIGSPFWKTWWFILLEILSVAVLTGLFFLIRNKRTLRAEEIKNRIKSEMQELHIRVIKAQMNPHFIFNSLNSIQEFILQQDNENALNYLSKFAKLIRKLIESNTAESLSLDDEIDILRKYIELESLRFGGSFEYEVDKSPNIFSSWRIPQMIVQPIVENAIWHGLLPKKGERKLKITFSERDSKTIYCHVDDNGVGREAASKMRHRSIGHKSLAINFIKQRLYLLSRAMNVECGISVEDKKINGEAAGTCVEIVIPLMNNK